MRKELSRGYAFVQVSKLIILACLLISSGSHAQTTLKSTDAEGAISSKEPRVIDYSELDNFHEGFAVVRKGDKYAIIDTFGNERAPLGKYAMTIRTGYQGADSYSGFYKGRCLVQDVNTMLYGFLDTAFKLVVPCIYAQAKPFRKDGYALVTLLTNNGNTPTSYFLDTKGNRYEIKNGVTDESAPWSVWVFLDNNERAYYRKNGTLALKTKLELGKFSDGYYQIQTSFNGVMKTGFFDTVSRQVLPTYFTGDVDDFSEGLAVYTPRNQDDYFHSVINKKGEEIIFLRKSDSIIHFGDLQKFRFGYADCKITGWSNTLNFNYAGGSTAPAYGDAFIDRNGHLTTLEGIFKKQFPDFLSDLSEERYYENNLEYLGRNKDGIFFSFHHYSLAPNSSTQEKLYGNNLPDPKDKRVYTKKCTGMMSYEGKILIPPVYRYIGPMDPVSGFAKAANGINHGSDFDDEFFINRKGEIVLKLKQPAKYFTIEGTQSDLSRTDIYFE